ncbi:hypothetical protein B0T21DRAFT_151547 [Apiosordaria backusii]|uniref:PHD-type domain-containing protein n=1 Tax=Apiosordaria backusii TaxID=314023 RepID=A0AA40BT86_9PEZI|nr:hypothetical protein B0T21DRAFT_151547 [Apiosordaria backusii]
MPRCKRCKAGETPDKALFRCHLCSRCYHPSCHRPLPKDPSNWICKNCSDQSQPKKRHYHENPAFLSSSSSRAVSQASSSTASHRERLMVADSIMAHSLSSTLPGSLVGIEQDGQRDSEDTFLQSCPWPDCTAQINVKEVAMCPEHTLFLKGNSHSREPIAPEPRATPVPTVTANLASDSNPPNPKKMLSERSERSPILKRKSAPSGAPRSNPQPTLNSKSTLNSKYGSLPPLPSKTKGASSSPSPNQTTLSSTGIRPTMASAPPQYAPPAPAAFSPPMSPTLLKDMEPPKKRQKVSPVLLQSNESRLNGNGTPTIPQPTLRSPENRPDKERRTSLKQTKPAVRKPVRKMAPMKHLRFTDEPNNDVPSPSVNRTTPAPITNGLVEKTMSVNPPSSSTTLSRETPEHIDKMGIDLNPPAHPTRLILTSQQETQEFFSTAHSVAPYFHPPRADYFAQETQSLVNNVDSPSDSPAIIPPETEKSTPNGVNVTPKAKRPKKLVIATKPPPPTKAIPRVTPTDLDYFIYSQPGASTPPRGLEIPGLSRPPPASASASSSAVSQQPPKQESQNDEPLALDIDPRIHYPQPHSLAWHAMKAQEIEARGTRKQRFGKAAQSLQRQMEAQAELNVPWEETLPEKIQENPAWVRALRVLKGVATPTPAENESGGDSMDFTLTGGIVGAAHGNDVSGTVVNGVERKVRKMKRTGSGLSIMSRDGTLVFGDRSNGNGNGNGSVNGSFGANGYGMN